MTLCQSIERCAQRPAGRFPFRQRSGGGIGICRILDRFERCHVSQRHHCGYRLAVARQNDSLVA